MTGPPGTPHALDVGDGPAHPAPRGRNRRVLGERLREQIVGAALVALDLRAAVHGAVAMRVNQPTADCPPLEAQVDRLLTRLARVDWPEPGD